MSNLLQPTSCVRHPRPSPSPQDLAIATWNVRGLNAASKKQTLGEDCEHYKIDIACIQETKIAAHSEQLLQTGHKLVLMEQKLATHRGLGFVIGPRLLDRVLSFGYVSDRVATIDLAIPMRKAGTTTKCRIVNAYGPTTDRAREDPSLVDSFYAELSSAINIPSRWQLFVCGDFNSKLGKLRNTDKEAGLNTCMGSYGMGIRNSNGDALVEFISANGLFVTNTAFKHPCRHRTTWTGHIADRSAPAGLKATIAVFNQIDFVICRGLAKPLLKDSRSYGGADLNSDHKPVVTRLKMNNICLIYKRPPKQGKKVTYDLPRLTSDRNTQGSYEQSVREQVAEIDLNCAPNDALAKILKCVEKSAASTVGILKHNKTARYTNDPLVVKLSQEQKALRLSIYQSGKSEDRTKLRKERNIILRHISERLKELAIQQADSLSEEITSTDDCRKMFRAARALKVSGPPPSLAVHNSEGNFIGTDQGKADAIREWFSKQFTDPDDEPLKAFAGNPKPLQVPITDEEVNKALKALNNGRACGPDGISNELFKYASNAISTPIAHIINSAFEEHLPIDAVGQGTLIALPKPKKPPGPPANLRPIVLLNSIRKILSNVTLYRIRDKIDRFTGAYQSGFKRGRSCADIVWAQRMLVSVVMSKHWDFHKMGIDMSRAFDTIKRLKILDVLKLAGCNEDDLRLVRLLLADTKLTVRVKSVHSAVFETSIGSPQGDGLSPVLFTCYLAAALSSVRENSTRPNPPVSTHGMPLEMEYADDVDFLDEEKEPLDGLLPVAAEQLKAVNLFMNEAKTEYTHVYLANSHEVNQEGDNIRGEEKWRKSRILGSLLCSTTDISARCVMGHIAFRSFWKLWIRGSKIPLKKKLRLYNATCVPLMLYNCNSWAAPKAALNKLDACHRKHLRVITGHKWPDSLISNVSLYKMCNTVPLSFKVNQQRWSMFSHVLRMPEDTPAQRALEFAVLGADRYKARTGRHCTNLLSVLRTDLKDAGLGTLRSSKKLRELRKQAQDKSQWLKLKKD